MRTDLQFSFIQSAGACLALLLIVAGCGAAGGRSENKATDSSASASVAHADAKELADEGAELDGAAIARGQLSSLHRLRRRGQFEQFVEAAATAADNYPNDAGLHSIHAEGLLASGQAHSAEASALKAARLGVVSHNDLAAEHALKQWAIARFRQKKSLGDATAQTLLSKLPGNSPTVKLLRFWSERLGGRSVCRASQLDSAGATPLARAVAEAGTMPAELCAVQATAGGAEMPRVFIDTGAQYTLMTVEAAQRAKVRFGEVATHLTGFVGLAARPGLLDTLVLGTLTLHDVPVLVGDSKPLIAQQGQMALGTELMHHVRFTIDYPRREVFAYDVGGVGSAAVESSQAESKTSENESGVWEIPLWTFSQVCLARGQQTGGASARVLIDTGDRAGTFVSPRWARRNLSQFQRSTTGLIFKNKYYKITLDAFELGTRALNDWRVLETFPHELDLLDQVDVLIGHDLLGAYQLTIDMPARRLQLRYEQEAVTARAEQTK